METTDGSTNGSANDGPNPSDSSNPSSHRPEALLLWAIDCRDMALREACRLRDRCADEIFGRGRPKAAFQMALVALEDQTKKEGETLKGIEKITAGNGNNSRVAEKSPASTVVPFATAAMAGLMAAIDQDIATLYANAAGGAAVASATPASPTAAADRVARQELCSRMDQSVAALKDLKNLKNLKQQQALKASKADPVSQMRGHVGTVESILDACSSPNLAAESKVGPFDLTRRSGSLVAQVCWLSSTAGLTRTQGHAVFGTYVCSRRDAISRVICGERVTYY